MERNVRGSALKCIYLYRNDERIIIFVKALSYKLAYIFLGGVLRIWNVSQQEKNVSRA